MLKAKVPGKVSKKDTAETVPFEEIKKDNKSNETLQEPQIADTITETTPEYTKTVEVKDNKENPKVTIDFMSEEYNKEFISQQTKRSAEPKEDIIGNKTAEDLKIERESKPALTVADMRSAAAVLIGIADMGISAGLRLWARDTSDSAYSVSESKKSFLVDQLAICLVDLQTKFNPWVMLLMAVVVAYSVPFTNAKRRRKVIKVLKEKNEVVNDKNIQRELDENSPALKREQGRPSKNNLK